MFKKLVQIAREIKHGKRYVLAEKTSREDVLTLIHKLHPRVPHSEMIRLGPDGDGGYLLPNDLNGIVACYSPGVDKVCGFESDCAKLGMKVYMADYSVEGPPDSNPLFIFEKKYIGSFSNDIFMTLDDWVSSPDCPKGDLMLQIDIEGFEYEALLSASEPIMARFKIIVAEFHNLDSLFEKSFFLVAKRTFEKLLKSHSCVHIHPNNSVGVRSISGVEIPAIMEFTFCRHDMVNQDAFQAKFPHKLDFDCWPANPIALPKCWHR